MSSISGQKKALAIIPKFTGTLSLLGSLCVIFDVLFVNNNPRSKRKLKSKYHRIMLGLSVFDFIASFVNILSTWPTPSDQAGSVFLASGSTATCTAQGFFNELGNITTPLYSASLCVWYLLYLKYGWKERDCRRIEYLLHGIPMAVGLGMAVVGLPFALYNNSGYLCWYAPYPAGCEGDTCTRGRYAGVFRWIHYGIVWSAIAFVSYAMASIYVAVRRQEDVTRSSILSNTGRTKSRAVARQALLYVCALYSTWVFTTATRISQTVFKHHSSVLLILMATFFPLQGFWNALIYFRPKHPSDRQRSSLTNLSNQSPVLSKLSGHSSSFFASRNASRKEVKPECALPEPFAKRKDLEGFGTSDDDDDESLGDESQGDEEANEATPSQQ